MTKRLKPAPVALPHQFLTFLSIIIIAKNRRIVKSCIEIRLFYICRVSIHKRRRIREQCLHISILAPDMSGTRRYTSTKSPRVFGLWPTWHPLQSSISLTTITQLPIWIPFCTYVHIFRLFQHEAVVYFPEASSFLPCQQQLHKPGPSAATDLLLRSAYLHTALEWPPKNSNALHESFLSVRLALAKEHRPSVS